MSKINKYYNLLSEYNTLINLISYHSKYLEKIEELKKQIPEEYFNKSKEQVKLDFKNVINELLKNNDNNIVFRSFYFTFSLDIYIMTQNDTVKKDLNKLTKEEQLDFIDRTIDYLLIFYKYNNLTIKYYDKVNFSLLNLKINDDTVNMINSNNDVYENIKSFVLCCKNFYKIKQQFIRNYTNYFKDINFSKFYNYNPFDGNDANLDFEDEYQDMLISYYTKHMNFKENIKNLVIAYIAGNKLFIRENKYSIVLYYELDFVNSLYLFYIFEIPLFDQYFVNTNFYNKDKYKKSIDYFNKYISKNTLDDIFNFYLNK